MRLTSGVVFFSHVDGTVGRLTLGRTYNSARTFAPRYGVFGRGWNSLLDLRVNARTSTILDVRDGSGEPVYYVDDNADLSFQPELPAQAPSSVAKTGNGYVRSFRSGAQETYDLDGRILTVTDPAGRQTTYSRDDLGRVTSVTLEGRALTLEYEGNSAGPARLLGPDGAILAQYAYDVYGTLERVEYADHTGYTYVFDSQSRITLVSELTGRIVEKHEYDGQGRATTSEIADGQEKLVLSYGTNATTVTDALGNVTTYDFATVNHIPTVTKVTGPCTSCGGGGGTTQEWTYDAAGNATAYKDGAGKTWTYTYDANGNVLTATDPLSHVTTYTYDAQDRVLTVSRPGGGLATYVHGPAGPTSITEKVSETENRTTQIGYLAGRPQTITDPRSKTTVLAYNTTGDLASVTDPLGHASSFGYDGYGRRSSATDALTHATATSYDGRGRVKRITSPDATYTEFTYDESGRRRSVRDPLGRVTTYTYDGAGRLASVIDPADGVVRYGYDAMSNLLSLTDPNRNTTAFEYNAYRQVKKVIYPGGAFESFTYDAAGRLATRTDRKNVTTTYAYDDLGRLTGKTYSDGTTPAVSYTYDPAGRLATAANGTDTLTWTYSLAGDLLSETSTRNASTVAYTYDAAGNRLTLSLDGQLFVSYGYDDASRLTAITRGANTFAFGYDNANRRTSLTYPNGVATSYAYDTLSRLTNLTAARSGTTVTQWDYVYDAAGNRTRKTGLDHQEDYTYDALYRLREVHRSGSLGERQTIYDYDPAGNRLREQVDNDVTTYAYDERNELLSTLWGGKLRFRGTIDEPGTVTVAGQQAHMLSGNTFEATIPVTAGLNTVPVTATDASGNSATKNYQVDVGGNTAGYSYDANGNLTQKVEGADTWTYEWNGENQLTRVVKNAAEQARFAYDALGRRVERVAGGVTTAWAYEGEDILRETSAGATVKYVHGPGIDEPLAQESAGGLFQLHADGLGSIVKTTDAVGMALATRRYDAFGILELGATNGYAFTGREWDSEAGLYYYRARYYDPKIGRFLSEDSAGQVNGPNLYTYVDNSPVNSIDPSGHYTVKTGDKRFDKKIHEAMDKLQEELLNAPPTCGCMKWFMDRRQDLITLTSPGGPPTITFNKEWSPSHRGSAHTPKQTVELNYNMVMLNEPCYLAGVILHEMGHLAGWSGSHPDEGLDKACTFGCVKTPRGGGHR